MPNPDEEAVKKGVGYDKEGTPLEGVTAINKILRGNEHELVFEWSDFAKFPDIEKDLDNDLPVIAWIKQTKDSPIHHSMVIRGVNNTDLRVYVNDPDPDEPKEHSLSDFMKAWDIGDRILIRAQVRTRPKQRRLDETQ